MPARLELRDGEPWWLSPDIWVVPGEDPNGASGVPIAGRTNYLWARVHNRGDQGVIMARVDFYWSNPATGVLRSNSTPVGSSFVDLEPGETKEVLCITPWVPIIVNGGHECVVAQVIHPAHPLPTPLPDPFDPPSYLQVAQRNLAVVSMSSLRSLVLPIQISTPARARHKEVRIQLETDPAKLSQEVLATVGLAKARAADDVPLRASFVDGPGCGQRKGQEKLALRATPGTQQAVYLQIESPAPFEGYKLLHVVERTEEQTLGGITFLITHPKEE